MKKEQEQQMHNNTTKTGIVLALIVCATVIVTMVGTYAFLTGGLLRYDEERVEVQTATSKIIFDDGDAGINTQLRFTKSVTKKFKIENTGTMDNTSRMNWVNLTNTYIDGSLTYTLSYATEENGTYTDIVKNQPVPTSNNEITTQLVSGLKVPAGKTYYYNLTITLNYLDGVNQDEDLNAHLTTRFNLDDNNTY